LTRIHPGSEVRGRIAGTGLDEARDEPLLIIEGTDGQRHLVPQTAAIARARGAGGLRPGQIVTLRGRSFSRGTKSIEYTEIAEHGRLRDLKRVETPSTPLDLEGLQSVRKMGELPPESPADRGFFQQWRRSVRSRAAILERFGLIRAREPEHESARERTYQITEGAEHMVESRMAERERTPMTLEELECAEPVYETVPGWTEDISEVRDFGKLPDNTRRYIEKIERLVETPAALISVGPGRDATIARVDLFA